jgi:hypothetical protein
VKAKLEEQNRAVVGLVADLSQSGAMLGQIANGVENLQQIFQGTNLSEVN